ncbi:hypothetical protein ACSS6W_001318 [Trichoderma asperelloides]
MSDEQEIKKSLKRKLANMPDDSTEEKPAARIVYRTESRGVASIALVATRMLRDLLYSREQMTSRDIQEMEHFLIYIGGERGIQYFAKELCSIGQNDNATSDTRFRDLFGHDGTFASAP